jgi:hypothetical protein
LGYILKLSATGRLAQRLERCVDIAEVTGSNPVSPTTSAVHINEGLPLRHLTNEKLFQLYDSDLVLRLHNTKNLSDTRKMLAKFKEYLGAYPPITGAR